MSANDQNTAKEIDKLCQWLEKKHTDIMQSENEALKALDTQNVDLYCEKMREKAHKLVDLSRESKPYLANLPNDIRMQIEHGIDSFSSGATTALGLDSVFYMSALLYPDDHKKGEPDNLELFIEQLKKY